jgi:hypothetical protein
MDPSYATNAADLVIGISYFAIPLEIFFFVIRRRYIWNVEGLGIVVACLFILFIMSCGITHILNVVSASSTAIFISKLITAIVSVLTSVTLCFVLPRALNLPLYLHEIKQENKYMLNFRIMSACIWRVLKEDSIIANARVKLHRILPDQTLIDITHNPSHETGPDVLSILILDGLRMYVRKSRLEQAQLQWLQDICIQIRFAILQARILDQVKKTAGGLDYGLENDTLSERTGSFNAREKEESLGLKLRVTSIFSRIETIVDLLHSSPGATDEQTSLIIKLREAMKGIHRNLEV